jgi:hypothetical protein
MTSAAPIWSRGQASLRCLQLDRNAEHRVGAGHVDDARVTRGRARVTVAEQVLDRAQVVRVPKAKVAAVCRSAWSDTRGRFSCVRVR